MISDVRVINELVQRESAFIEPVLTEVRKVIVGQDGMVERIVIGLLTGGHVLLEGVPGLAKTLTVKTLCNTISAKFQRIQFTPDLLPADVIGTVIYNQQRGVHQQHRNMQRDGRRAASRGLRPLSRARVQARTFSSMGRQMEIRSLVSSMSSTILRNATPPFELVADGGANLRTRRYGSYHDNIVPQVEASGVGPSATLSATVLAPVSGHVGAESARQWAKTDTFSIYVQHGNGPRTTLASNVRSTDLVTSHDIKVPLKKGEITKVFYDRSGSAGVAGFPSGRTIEIVWNGN
jgi:hypothetical protein